MNLELMSTEELKARDAELLEEIAAAKADRSLSYEERQDLLEDLRGLRAEVREELSWRKEEE